MFSLASSKHFSFKTVLIGLLSLASFFSACPSSAAAKSAFELGNGGFELGNFTGWKTVGRTFIETARYGSGPTQGTYQALLDTFSKQTVGIGELATLLRVDIDNLKELGDVYEGSAIATTFTVEEGDVVSFDWNFLTDNNLPTKSFNDFAFVTISPVVKKLSDTFSTFPPSLTNLTDFYNQTGFETFSYTFTTAGTYSLGIGVADVGDGSVDSGLLVDNVSLLAKPMTPEVPEPTTVSGVLAFGALGVVAKFLRRK